MTDLADYCAGLGRRARAAARALALLTTGRQGCLAARRGRSLEAHTADLLAANERDLAAAEANGLTAAQIDRLRLTPARIKAAADGMRASRRPARPGRPGARRRRPAERPAGDEGRRAARRDSVSSTNRGRTSRSTPPPWRQERQRPDPPRRQGGVALQHRPAPRADGRRPACRPTPCNSSTRRTGPSSAICSSSAIRSTW